MQKNVNPNDEETDKVKEAREAETLKWENYRQMLMETLKKLSYCGPASLSSESASAEEKGTENKDEGTFCGSLFICEQEKEPNFWHLGFGISSYHGFKAFSSFLKIVPLIE